MVTKASPSRPEEDINSLDIKYRPATLERVIGQEAAVTRLRGMLASDKIPNAIAFFGPPSSGKTTLARCLAVAVNGKPVKQQQDWRELNAANEKSIEDVRDLERLAKFKPINKRRFIFIDEAQQWLSNDQAAQAVLKPLEEPAKGTTWILGSMNPDKFATSKTGKAILSRCDKFILQEPSASDLLKQAIRIAKGEGMTYVLDEERALLKSVVRESDQSMRELAKLMQSLQQYYDGIEGKKPKILDATNISAALSSVTSNDDACAVRFLKGLYEFKFTEVQLALLDVTDAFGFVKKIVWMSQFMLNTTVLKNKKHPKVWWSGVNREIHTACSKMELNLGIIAAVAARLIRVQAQSLSFQMPALELLSSECYYLIRELSQKED